MLLDFFFFYPDSINIYFECLFRGFFFSETDSSETQISPRQTFYYSERGEGYFHPDPQQNSSLIKKNH